MSKDAAASRASQKALGVGRNRPDISSGRDQTTADVFPAIGVVAGNKRASQCTNKNLTGGINRHRVQIDSGEPDVLLGPSCAVIG